jgi:hypothetical protein
LHETYREGVILIRFLIAVSIALISGIGCFIEVNTYFPLPDQANLRAVTVSINDDRATDALMTFFESALPNTFVAMTLSIRTTSPSSEISFNYMVNCSNAPSQRVRRGKTGIIVDIRSDRGFAALTCDLPRFDYDTFTQKRELTLTYLGPRGMRPPALRFSMRDLDDTHVMNALSQELLPDRDRLYRGYDSDEWFLRPQGVASLEWLSPIEERSIAIGIVVLGGLVSIATGALLEVILSLPLLISAIRERLLPAPIDG